MNDINMLMWKTVGCMIVSLLLLSSAVFAEFNNYYGSVAVNSPAGMGNIDLAFHLDTDDNTGNMNAQSYIILDKTILFPQTRQVSNGSEIIDVGPKVQSGYLTDSAFYLKTQPFTSSVRSRIVNRQITLNGAPDPQQDNMIIGTYTETISGYLSDTINVTGDFILVRPVAVTGAALTADIQGIILALQICAGMNKEVDKATDLSGNDKIGIEDAIIALQVVAGIRSKP